ncbi:MAG: response regulator [Haloarculaceae archaeon]
MTGGRSATVLIVEDERHLADLYTEYLAGEYNVETAYSGEEALERLTPSVDVVLLDRRMPVVSGNEVLAEIEAQNAECRVAMVTAIDPDFDIIGMGIDDYVVKPVTSEELRDVVERLLLISEYNDRLRQLTTKKLKRNVLQIEKRPSELETSERFANLQSEIEQLESNVDSIADQLDIEKQDLRL